MTHYMGIDGGGSTLRVVITDENAQIQALVKRGTVNPNQIGREAAAALIREAMHAALAQAAPVVAVGIGIAGASAEYARDWLHEVIHSVLPDVAIAAASDNEIALVGALGQRYGLLILSGTGSGVFGVNEYGQALQVGGWGYLLGDEGSGYWIGLQALKATISAYDRGETSAFTQAILSALGISSGRDVIQAVYLREKPVPHIARLTPLVLHLADDGLDDAQAIVTGAVDALAQQANIARERLGLTDAPIAFAGSILSSDNAVSRGLCDRLGLSQRPQAKHDPVIGAALLAQLRFNKKEI